jgi:hypothetical protein
VEEAALVVGVVLAALVSVLRALPVLGVVVGKGLALAARSSSNNNSRSKEVSSKHYSVAIKSKHIFAMYG